MNNAQDIKQTALGQSLHNKCSFSLPTFRQAT